MRIGFIGLGNMGAPMAHNLAKAGHTVLGFDTQNLTVEMVEIVQSPIDCAEKAEVVITMLPNGKILKSVADETCLLYTSPSPRDRSLSRMPSSA